MISECLQVRRRRRIEKAWDLCANEPWMRDDQGVKVLAFPVSQRLHNSGTMVVSRYPRQQAFEFPRQMVCNNSQVKDNETW